MMITSWVNKFFIIMIVMFSTSLSMLSSQENSTNLSSEAGFALYLFEQGDYYRAITEFQRVSFTSNQQTEKNWASRYIAESYLYSDKANLLLQTLSKFSVEGLTPSEQVWHKALTGLGYYNLGAFNLAEQSWMSGGLPKDEQLLQYLGLAALKSGRTSASIDYFSKAQAQAQAQASEASGSSDFYEILSNRVDAYIERPVFSPLLAGASSAVVPGLGQWLTGHPLDGIQAFSLTAIGGLVTYGVFLYDKNFSSNYLYTGIGASVTAMFYLANIYGAVTTAGYRNQKTTQETIEPIEDHIFSRGLPKF